MQSVSPLFDINSIIASRNRLAKLALSNLPNDDTNPLQTHLANSMLERMDEITRDFSSPMLMGYKPQDASLLSHFANQPLTLLEPASQLGKLAKTQNSTLQYHYLSPNLTNIASLDIGYEQYDLILSNGFLHWIEDWPQLFYHIRQWLKPDGLFLASFIGGKSLETLQKSLILAEAQLTEKVSPHIIPMIDIKDAGALLQKAGFSLPMLDKTHISLEYDDFTKALKGLKTMGEQNMLTSRRRGLSPKTLFTCAKNHWHHITQTEDNAPVYLEFDIIFLTAWKPHPQQMQAKTPGSASHDLKDFL